MRFQETICSIVAADLKAGEFGIGTASTALAVGKNVPFTGAFVGAIAVQGYTGPFFGIAGMKLLRENMPAQRVVDEIMADDPLKDSRQVLAIDVTGQTGGYSGASLTPYAGIRQGENYIIGGCGLPGQDLIDTAAKAFEETRGDLAARLLRALEAMAGAMKESAFSSAAIRVSKTDPYPYIDLRVDSHPEPVNQLARLIDTWRKRTGAANGAAATNGAPAGAGGTRSNGNGAAKPPNGH